MSWLKKLWPLNHRRYRSNSDFWNRILTDLHPFSYNSINAWLSLIVVTALAILLSNSKRHNMCSIMDFIGTCLIKNLFQITNHRKSFQNFHILISIDFSSAMNSPSGFISYEMDERILSEDCSNLRDVQSHRLTCRHLIAGNYFLVIGCRFLIQNLNIDGCVKFSKNFAKAFNFQKYVHISIATCKNLWL